MLCRHALRVFGMRAMRAVGGFRSRVLLVGNEMLNQPSSYRVGTHDRCGSEKRTRTSDLAVNSRLLCLLSYLGMVGVEGLEPSMCDATV